MPLAEIRKRLGIGTARLYRELEKAEAEAEADANGKTAPAPAGANSKTARAPAGANGKTARAPAGANGKAAPAPAGANGKERLLLHPSTSCKPPSLVGTAVGWRGCPRSCASSTTARLREERRRP